jgi:two-component system cell cycle response regulator DivK
VALMPAWLGGTGAGRTPHGAEGAPVPSHEWKTMDLTHDPEQLAHIRDQVRTLVQRAAEHEDKLKALVTAEANVRHAGAVTRFLDLAHVCLDDLQRRLGTSLLQREVSAESIRQLGESAREQHIAASRLLNDLDQDQAQDEQRMEQRTCNGAVVLVADDYGNVREVLASVLQNAGFEVRTAANGLEALLAAYQMRPAIIIMDVRMPVLDGIEATRLIKASEAMRHTRVIAYTGDPVEGDSRMKTLFAAVLQKPATPAALLATVRHVASL